MSTATAPTLEQQLERILAAKHYGQIVNVQKHPQEFKELIQQIHPDVCKLPKAADATAHLNKLRDVFVEGIKYPDDAGGYVTNGYWAHWKSTEPCVKWSFENINRFAALSDTASAQFKKYLPHIATPLGNDVYQLGFEKRAIPLSGLTLPQEHANWILSRLLEYAAYLAQMEFVHCGLTPESVFIVPENHGIIISSFYHLTRIGNPVKTISAKYKDWYPPELFANKQATTAIDLQMVKKIAIYLLGDRSGIGVKLRKTCDGEFVNFLLQSDDDAFLTYGSYRLLLKNKFESKFHILNI